MLKTIEKNKIYIYLIIFMIISTLSIYNASLYVNGGKELYLKQLLWYIIGILFIIVINKIEIKKIYINIKYLYIINIIILLGLLIFGTKINNAKSWYKIANITIQPSEFLKPILIIINANIIDKEIKNRKKLTTKQEFKLILKILIITIIPSILVFLEPDTGSVISYIIIAIAMLYFSGINKRWFQVLITVIIITLLLLLVSYLIDKKIIVSLLGSKFLYRIERIIDWRNKNGMQLNNSLVAIGSSGLFGHKKVPLYYPEAATDFIFTTFSSTFGLVGSILLIIFLISFDVYIIDIIKKESIKKNKYTLFGILSLFFYQQLQSIAMTIGLTPINGITLPLISYGGSSLISYLISFGIIIKIKKLGTKH